MKARIGQLPKLTMTAANTAAMAADNTCQAWTTVEYRPCAQTAADGTGRCAHSYGSEGWGFESLRARHQLLVRIATLNCVFFCTSCPRWRALRGSLRHLRQ